MRSSIRNIPGHQSAHFSGVTNATAHAEAREEELEQLVAQARAKAQNTSAELGILHTKCQQLENQLAQHAHTNAENEEQQRRLSSEVESLKRTKLEVEKRVEMLLKSQEVSVQSFEKELGSWRSQVQEVQFHYVRACMLRACMRVHLCAQL